GLDKFAEQFKAYANEYVIIGGTATSLLLEEQGLSLMRVTKDIDMVVIVESLTEGFARAFWSFVKSGGYKVFERSDGAPQFFRFKNPIDTAYPYMIELFSRKQDSFTGDFNGTIIPLYISDDISSLSAILLNDEYYDFLTTGKTEVDGISLLKATHLIPFKAKAWLDLTFKKSNGQHVNSADISKHQNDVFRLAQLLTGGEIIGLTELLIGDMRLFIEAMEEKPIQLKDIGVRGDKSEILDLLRNIYLQEERT
ncbi:MAG: hypothetical protein LBT20_01345, partial [Clostridiales bacterium]|nr:hypothetical protein [Clostridiales bacterium]